MNEEMIVDIWNGVKEYIDKKQIETAASRFVDVLIDNGVDDDTLNGLVGSCEFLDEAIEYYLEENEDELDDEDDDDWDYEEE